MCGAQWYTMHIERHDELLSQLSSALKHHPDFERAFSDFEAQKVCYLPIGAFLLKPIQRLLQYHGLLERELLRTLSEIDSNKVDGNVIEV